MGKDKEESLAKAAEEAIKKYEEMKEGLEKQVDELTANLEESGEKTAKLVEKI